MALRTGEKALRIGLPSGRLSPGEAPARISDNAKHTARMKPRQDAGRRPHRRIRPPPLLRRQLRERQRIRLAVEVGCEGLAEGRLVRRGPGE